MFGQQWITRNRSPVTFVFSLPCGRVLFYISQVCVCVFWELTNCKMLLCCCTICTVDSVQQAGHQSLAAILHLRPHFTAAFHVLPMFTMFGPTLHVMQRKVLYSGVRISSLVQGVS